MKSLRFWKVFDPQGPFLQRWKKIFLFSRIIAAVIDPLFFYVLVINNDQKCLDFDYKVEITACVLRSFIDIFYVLHIIFQFRTGFTAPSSRVFGRGVLVEDSLAIARRYLSSYFLIDILAVLPLPQVAVLIATLRLKRGSAPLNAIHMLQFIVPFQYIPRLVRIHPIYREVTISAGIITETLWAQAAFNLFLYMLASHGIGGFWYLLSIEREDTCWRKACDKNSICIRSLYCGGRDINKDFLATLCPFNPENATVFDYGIYLSALKSEIVQSRHFLQRLFYCFWWGLQNLSALGQNLQTSTYAGEISFAVFISICGLVLFSLLIGNMQTYLRKYMESSSVRLEEMRLKMREAEQWMSRHMLPEDLRRRVRRYEEYKWQETRGFNEEHLLHDLPKDLRRDIKRHLYLALLMRVPVFEKLDEQLLDAMCDRLKPVLYREDTYIVREGDPVDEMLFIREGILESVTTNGGRVGFFNRSFLKAGDFCGEELLTWALDPRSSYNLPTSTRTVKARSEVIAVALMTEDLKYVLSQFRRLHSRQIRHTFRFYSPKWRTWAALFIQAAWRYYRKKKLEKALHDEEDRLQEALAKGAGSSSSLGVTIYASRFAANALGAIKRRNKLRKAKVPHRLPPLLLPKPVELDYTIDDS